MTGKSGRFLEYSIEAFDLIIKLEPFLRLMRVSKLF